MKSMMSGSLFHSDRFSRLSPSWTLDFPRRYVDQPPPREWQNIRTSTSDTRYALYLPRNLSFCSLCPEAITQHLARKVVLLNQSLYDMGYSTSLGSSQSKTVASEPGAWLSDESDSSTPYLLSPEESSSNLCTSDNQDFPSFLTRRPEPPGGRRPSSILRKERSKSYAPPSQSPKKVVRFADSLGLELEAVRHLIFSDLPPYIPSSAFSDLHQCQNSMELEAEFTNPCSRVDFNARLRRQGVLLHSIRSYYTSVYGLVSVVNLTYHKSVTVRYSLNGWKSFLDTRATFVPKPSDTKASDTDQFRFTIFANPKDFHGTEQKLSFAVCFKTEDGQERWDNNGGLNYNLIGHQKHSPYETNNGRTWVHFL